MSDQDKTEIGEFVAQSKSNATSIKEMRDEFLTGMNRLREGLERLSDRLTTATAPNFSTLAALSAVLLTIIGMVAAPIGFFVWNAIIGLDTKLQKEYQLSIQTTTQGIDNLNNTSRERHEDATRMFQTLNERMARDEAWRDDQIKAELQELRELRKASGR